MIETKFKQTEIGPIPEDWEVKSVEEFAKITTGSQNTQDKEDGGKYPFYVRSQNVERIDKYIFDADGVVTAGDGVGTGKVYHRVSGKFGLHQRCYLIYELDEVNVDYFYWVFSIRFYERVMSMTAKSSVDSVRREMIADMLIPLPPLAEQKKIAKALSDVDALINNLEGLIAKKRDIKQGTMQQLLTGKKRLSGFTGKWNCNAMWELTAWDKFFSEVEKGKQKKVIRYPYLLAANMEAMEQSNGNVYLLATGNYEGWTTEEIAGNHLCEGEVVSIPWGGYANIKYTKGKFVTADNRIATSLDTSILDNKYLYYYMLQNKKTFDSFYRGAGIQHPSMADVLDFEILYPSIDEQRAIATILTDMDDEIQALEAKRDKYTAIKQGMMQELLTGKIRLV